MNPKIKSLSIVSLIVITAISFTGCGYWYKHKSPEKKAEWIVNEIQDELNLNEAQLVKLNKLKETILMAKESFKSSHKDHHNQMTELLEQSTLDSSKLQSMVDTKLEFIGTTSTDIILDLTEFYNSLTPEQQQEIRKEWEEKSERHHRYGWH